MDKRPFHIVPVNDTRLHITDGGDCWCEPAREDGLVIHNAADGREFFEEDEREAILAGLQDMAAGRVIPAEEVRRRLNYEKG